MGMTAMKPVLRRGNAADHDALGLLMHAAVHGPGSPYRAAQRQAWIAAPRSGPDWDARLSGQTIILAEQDDHPVGFMTLAPPDCVDFAFIHPDWQGCGLFRRLYQALEDHARETGIPALRVHASLQARPAFAAMGFAVTAQETVTIGDQSLARFAMEKSLPPPATG
ncbi:hypothetical protein AWH62_01735 [Maricaulis sp. W15]|nr:hypothetical protein AWH62_01735 [Maricaulis sp. W15]